ncbi:MAG: 5'/3'-nucleotidase SurE [Candidatus Hydrogenedentes bacterium]|nr:5'/3'-nucleotidase SurE [Candidatus Hydrogenedentota bacterium]
MAQPLILVTNDDGIRAPGIIALAEALRAVGEVCVYAPEGQQSAVGHGVSLHKPLRVNELQPGWFSVDGTPTDCVMLAVRDLLGRRPDLVVSGVNTGANLGDDVTYSGTVAGAFEGMLLGIHSIAVSDVSYAPRYLETAAAVAAQVALHVLEHGIPEDTLLNVNVPDLPYAALQGTMITRMGRRTYQDEIVRRTDPRGGTYYWIGGAEPAHVTDPGTDFDAIEQDKVSITPLHRDLTNHSALHYLHGLNIGL